MGLGEAVGIITTRIIQLSLFLFGFYVVKGAIKKSKKKKLVVNT